MKPAYKIILVLLLTVVVIVFLRYNTSKYISEYPIQPTITPTSLPTLTPTPNPNLFKVKRVIDGDTFVLDNNQKVRLIGINAPESDDCYASESTDIAIQLLEGKEVFLEKDTTETDKHERLLRYAYVDNIFINEYLVEEGYAKVAINPPDIKYKNKLSEAEIIAKENNNGLWGYCQGELEY